MNSIPLDDFRLDESWKLERSSFMPDTYAESVDVSRASVLLELQRAREHLKSVDDKILELVLEREHAITELETAGNQALGGWLCTADALDLIADAYARLGWKSKLACALVGHLRRLLLDDKKIFKDTICYGMERSNLYSADGSTMRSVTVTFGPKNHDITKAFQISLVGRGGMKFEWKHHYIETDIRVWSMVSDDGDHFLRKPLIARSAKLSDIRKAIHKFVKTGEHESFKVASPESECLKMIIYGLTSGELRRKLGENMLVRNFESQHSGRKS